MNEKLKKLKAEKESIISAMKDPHLCEDTASVYSRISGYYRATKHWCKGKSVEFKERKEYKI